jgi:hypothetical protein
MVGTKRSFREVYGPCNDLHATSLDAWQLYKMRVCRVFRGAASNHVTSILTELKTGRTKDGECWCGHGGKVHFVHLQKCTCRCIFGTSKLLFVSQSHHTTAAEPRARFGPFDNCGSACGVFHVFCLVLVSRAARQEKMRAIAHKHGRALRHMFCFGFWAHPF